MHGVADAWRGGWRHTEADGLVARMIEARFPGTAEHTRQEREFLHRAVSWAAQRGIAQYVVAAAGPPDPDGSVHGTARETVPGATAVYAGADPSAVTWSRWLLAEGDPGVAAVSADFIRPGEFFTRVTGTGCTDLAEPVCLVTAMVLHTTPPERAPGVISGLAAHLAPESAVILSVPSLDGTPDAAEFAGLYSATGKTMYRHEPEAIAGWVKDARLDLVPPGVVPVTGWPSGLVPRSMRERTPGYIAAAVAVKP